MAKSLHSSPSATVMLTGDVMTGRGVDQVLGHPSKPLLHEPYIHDARDYVRMAETVNGQVPAPVPSNYIWGDLLPEIDRHGPDVRIVNLETAVTTSSTAWPGKSLHYRMHPDNVDCLTSAGIDCCVMANNHVLDWGRQGLDETLHVLQQAGLQTAGAGEDGDEAWAPAVLPLAGRARMLVFACSTTSSGVPAGWSAAPRTPGIALFHELSDTSARLFAEDVARRRSPGDLVMVSIHWGSNWGLELPSAHREFAHQLIDLGAADIVHGHSSHHPLPIEIYRGKPIFYGCGDLINDYEGIAARNSLRSDVGCLYFVTLYLGSGRLKRLEIIPVQLRRFRLTPADAPARAWLERIFVSNGARLESLPGARKFSGWTLHWNQPA